MTLPVMQSDAAKDIPVSKLYVRLVSVDQSGVAVIEDGFTRSQDVFAVGDWVWNQAQLVKVNADNVYLAYNGKIEKLPIKGSGRIFRPGESIPPL
ncbi:hypothetical protein JNK13_09880 [bacterium]|nr:hypothetical protein [bacterium]